MKYKTLTAKLITPINRPFRLFVLVLLLVLVSGPVFARRGPIKPGPALPPSPSIKIPVPSPTPTLTPTPTPPVTPLSCYPTEWKCRDSDISRPDIWCCKEACFLYPPNQDSACRTNQDEGQKDGTGKSGLSRKYPYFDYSQQKILQVPPALGMVSGPTPLPTPTPGTPTCDNQCPVDSGHTSTSFCQNIVYSGTIVKHKGMDIGGNERSVVKSASCGTVLAAGWDTTGYGNWVKISGNDGNIYTYGHLSSKLLVKVGETVSASQPIGSVGHICDSPSRLNCSPSDPNFNPACRNNCGNGRSSGAHLHFEVRSPSATNLCEAGENQVDPYDIFPAGCSF